MTIEEIRLLGVAVSAIASLLSFLGIVYVARINRRHAFYMQRAAQEKEAALEEVKKLHSQELAGLQAKLSNMSHRSQKNYEKKLEVLSNAFDKLGKIQALVESYVVPYTEYTKSRDPNKLVEACMVFEELREFHLRNSIFFDKDDKLGSSMGAIMGQLNYLVNISKSSDDGVIPLRQKSFQDVISPAVYSVKEQYQRALAV